MSATESKTQETYLENLLNNSNDIKIYTCEDFKGNIEITIGDYMYLFYAKQIKNSENILLEKPISIYDMNIESPTPGTANFISLNISNHITIEQKTNLLMDNIHI